MSYKVPTLEELHGFLIAYWKALFPKSNVGSRFSYHWKRLRAFAGGVTDLHAHIDSAQNDVMPDTALGTFLARWGNIVGVGKKTATGARKANALRVTGTVASPIGIGFELTHGPTGLRFQTAEAGVIAAAGYVDIDISAIDTGSLTRLNANEVLTFTAPPGGINTKATVVIALDEDGFDNEQDGAYSVRVNAELSEPRLGGHEADFVKWMLEVPGVSAAFAYANRAGIGTMDCVGMHAASGSARSLTPTERATALAYLKTKAPSQVSGTGGGLRVLTTVNDDQKIKITVKPNGDQAYAFDWDDTVAPVVLAWTAATRLLQFTAARPASMLAGHRLSLDGVATVQDGRQYTIELLSGADSVILKETPPVNPAATDIVYAGGPLVDPIRDAIIAHVNGEIVYADAGVPTPASVAGTRAPRLKVLALGMGPANPAGKYGAAWSGALVRAMLGKIAAYPTGARNITILLPAADYEATDDAFPNDANVHFVAPLEVLVRNG